MTERPTNAQPSARSQLDVVAWTKGQGCAELAEVLADDRPAERVRDDLGRFCVERRVRLLVTRRHPSSFDLVATAVPAGLDIAATTEVIAAVGSGPHSALAATVAARIARALGVDGTLLSVYRHDETEARAKAAVEAAAELAPGLSARVERAGSIVELVEGLSKGAILVFGAGGGSWIRRAFFGTASRLRSAAPAGAVIVHTAPARAFQHLDEGEWVSPLLAGWDAGHLHRQELLPVVSDGRLVGLVRRSAVLMAGHGVRVGDLMEPPRSVGLRTPWSGVVALGAELGGGPVPVVDADDRFRGVVDPAASVAPWSTDPGGWSEVVADDEGFTDPSVG